MFEDRGIIPECSNGLTHLYNANKKKFNSRHCPNHYKMFMKMFIICQNLNTPLLDKNGYLNGAQQQYENTNVSKKELKLIKTFSIASFEKVKIKLTFQIQLSRISQLSSG